MKNLPNIFESSTTDKLIDRINNLKQTSMPLWGKMSVDKMLAHCNVTYEMAFENMHKKPNALMRFVLKSFVKKMVVNEKPYAKNGNTAPEFIIKSDKDFDLEKKRLLEYIVKTQKLGAEHFEGKESLSFGNLTSGEWNNMFYKHLDHHLRQFGV